MTKLFKIVNTDNFGSDYPEESFLPLTFWSQKSAQRVADAINAELCKDDHATRFWKVVDSEYQLQPGFEP
jgi:hypothetical protein